MAQYEFVPKMTWAAGAAILGFLLSGTATFTLMRAEVRDLQQQTETMNNDGTKFTRNYVIALNRELTEIKVKNAEIAVELKIMREMMERMDKKLN